jgi:hypothetical protein
MIQVDSKAFQRRCVTELFDFWISFCPQVKGETPTLGPLERANFNH